MPQPSSDDCRSSSIGYPIRTVIALTEKPQSWKIHPLRKRQPGHSIQAMKDGGDASSDGGALLLRPMHPRNADPQHTPYPPASLQSIRPRRAPPVPGQA